MSRRVEKALDACSCGDRRALEVLRATSMAEMPADEFIEVVDAVTKAGRITNTIGLSRMLIQKGIRSYNAGVAKGDFVGHPFRGNQHSDSAGTSRGGAGGPRSGKPSRIGRRDTSEIEELNAQLDLMGDRKLMFQGLMEITRGDLKADADPKSSDFRQPMGTLQQAEKAGIDTPEGRKLLERARDEFEDKNHHSHAEAVQNVLRAKGPKSTTPSDDPKNVGLATDYVLSQIQMIMEDDEDSLKEDGAGVGNLRRAAEDGEQQALRDEEMLREAPDDGSSSAKEIKSASRRAQAKADLAEALNDTQKDMEQARKVLAATRAKADKESNPRRVGAVLSQGVRQAIGILETRRQTLQLESEAARANDKAGRGGGTGTQYGLPLSALQDRISGLQEIDADSRALNVSVDEMLKDDLFGEILEDES